MDADRSVGRAGAPGDEGDSGPSGHRAIGTRHKPDATFLPADDEVDFRRIVQRVEHGEEAFPWDGKDAIAALRDELVDQDAATGAGLGHAYRSSDGRGH